MVIIEMMRDKQIKRIADFLTDVGKISIGGLVLGQFLAEKVFSTNLFVVGLILSLICLLVALRLDGLSSIERED